MSTGLEGFLICLAFWGLLYLVMKLADKGRSYPPSYMLGGGEVRRKQSDDAENDKKHQKQN